MNKSKKNILWIIGGGQLQVPLIVEARKLKLNILVTDKDPNCVCKPLSDHFYPVDIFDISKNVELLLTLQAQGFEFRGVIAAGIDANVTAAVVAKTAGLPGVNPKAAYITHNKALFREFLAKNKLPSPKWEEVATLSQAKKAIKKISAPFIIKNIDSSASRGTRKFFTKPADGELELALEEAKKASTTNTALVEELLSGPEQTVETLFDANGKFRPCFITDRKFDVKSEWATELEVEHPTTLSIATQKKLYELVGRTAKLLGITTGAAKADTMVTKNGPVIIEMTTRLSGGFDCQYLVPIATGKNILRAAILTSLGKKFPASLLQDRKHRVAVLDSLWPKPGGRIVAIEGVEKAERMPGFELFSMRYKLGDIVKPYVDNAKRACFVIASGKDRKEAKENLKRILAVVSIKTKQA